MNLKHNKYKAAYVKFEKVLLDDLRFPDDNKSEVCWWERVFFVALSQDCMTSPLPQCRAVCISLFESKIVDPHNPYLKVDQGPRGGGRARSLYATPPSPPPPPAGFER